MTTPVPPVAETALQKEQRLFTELFSRLGNALLNRLFDLRPQRAAHRMQYLVILFFVSGFLVTLLYHPLSLWGKYIQDIFFYLFSQNYNPNFAGDPFLNITNFAIEVFTDPRSLQYLPIFLAPFFIALQSAGIYLADVFELEDVSVARSFIWEVALSGSDKTIRVSNGEISEQHRETPTFLIGGPGKVIGDLDSVALFEKPDGTPHVIGPTGKEPRGRATLDGFERFRQAIDIRDHYVDLLVKSRSRDGMPITATDVRLMFSIHRGKDPKPSGETPYPFDEKAIEQIVYRATSRVTPGQTNPSTHEFEWTNNMINLIRGELSGFMNKHNLSVYLASTGMPELEKIKQREEAIAEQIRNLTQSDEEKPKAKDEKGPPEFQPRHRITNLFTQFTEEFTNKSQFTNKSNNKGVELHWIGVGTWKSPIELVPEKHLEAWKISQENMGNESPGAMKGAEDKSRIEKMVALINTVPIEAYHEIRGGFKHSKKSGKKQDTKPRHQQQKHNLLKHQPKEEYEFVDDDDDDDILISKDDLETSSDELVEVIRISRLLQEQRERKQAEYYSETDEDQQKEAIQSLLLEYRKHFIEIADFIMAKKETVPQNIIEAIQHIEKQLPTIFTHMIRGS